MKLCQLAPSLALLGGQVLADLTPIVAKGSKFFVGDGGPQFFMKGIAYQQDPAATKATTTTAAGAKSVVVKYADPLADAEACRRDVPILKELGTNTIRTYAIDPTADHSVCMRLLQDAGIYVVSDLSEPQLSINRDTPRWTTELFARYRSVVDALARYPNVIGFFAGNEVSNAANNTGASAFVKAAVRDTKHYIREQHPQRWLGVGYAANDDRDISAEIPTYFDCGAADESVDFFGYNIYSWCGESDLEKSSYRKHAEFFRNYSVPVFFAEYGCREPGGAEGRLFQETDALYAEPMSSVFSGGIVFMYFQEENDFGLVKIRDGKAEKMKNLETLKAHVLKADPKGVVNMSDYSVPSSAAAKKTECPPLSRNWEANRVLPPTPDPQLCRCMVKSLGCVPKAGLTSAAMSDIFGYVCGRSRAACAGISTNTQNGVYGAYSMCDDEAKLAFVLDAYYKSQKSAAYACDFQGSAPPAANDAACKDALAKANEANAHAATATLPAGAAATGRGKGDDSGAARLTAAGWSGVVLYMGAGLCLGAAQLFL
ncbi:glycoside hydrolase family 72 protein [Moelleriella libera RCEF 2490]|uniref:1,3-beta-glucanosyltransferase n=1 Tax=Moelleriella libera RCEF 2490 TaxID=1081109 RepID=A0A167ZL12_9HYPO|nr:glycoside hydrolase family 72 protein [Moelleriella libera RCEF 2490]